MIDDASQHVAVPRYLSPADVCKIVPGLTERSLKEMRGRRVAGVTGAPAGPPFSKPTSKTVIYEAGDVASYLAAIKNDADQRR